MTFKKEYTDEQILNLLDKERSLSDIINALGCSKAIAYIMVHCLLKMGKITRRNVGSEKKPVWLYSKI